MGLCADVIATGERVKPNYHVIETISSRKKNGMLQILGPRLLGSDKLIVVPLTTAWFPNNG